jgi:hypothetical protein
MPPDVITTTTSIVVVRFGVELVEGGVVLDVEKVVGAVDTDEDDDVEDDNHVIVDVEEVDEVEDVLDVEIVEEFEDVEDVFGGFEVVDGDFLLAELLREWKIEPLNLRSPLDCDTATRMVLISSPSLSAA